VRSGAQRITRILRCRAARSEEAGVEKRGRENKGAEAAHERTIPGILINVMLMLNGEVDGFAGCARDQSYTRDFLSEDSARQWLA
jgi:hypothetical protein